jgi:hypothetical protein
LVREKEGNFCGRYYQRSDGRMLTADCLTGQRQRRSRLARWAGSVFATVLLCFGVRANLQADDTNKIRMGKTPAPHTNQPPVKMGEMLVMGDVAEPPMVMGIMPVPPRIDSPSNQPTMGKVGPAPKTNSPAPVK